MRWPASFNHMPTIPIATVDIGRETAGDTLELSSGARVEHREQQRSSRQGEVCFNVVEEALWAFGKCLLPGEEGRRREPSGRGRWESHLGTDAAHCEKSRDRLSQSICIE